MTTQETCDYCDAPVWGFQAGGRYKTCEAHVCRPWEEETKRLPSRVRVEWDTGEEEVENLPEVVEFSEEEMAEMRKEVDELVGEDEDEREDWKSHVIVKHLEALTGWLVKDWKEEA